MKNQKGNAGVGVMSLLGLLFLALKLMGEIDWSWWWVTLPFWGGTAIFVIMVVIALLLSSSTNK